MTFQSQWPRHTSDAGSNMAPGQDAVRPLDARRCTVQLSTGHLYLDAVATPETALLGHDSPPIREADGSRVRRMLSSLASGYRCLEMASSFAAAAQSAVRIGRPAAGSAGRITVTNALNGEPATTAAVLVAHENETIGRTGRWLASASWKRTPDLIVAGEALALGFPFGAVLARKGFSAGTELRSCQSEGGQSPNNAALARVKAAITMVENEGLLLQGLEVADYLMARLSAMRQGCPQIESIEGTGLSIRVAVSAPLLATKIRRKMCERGVLVGVDKAGRLAIDPPLPLRIAEADVITGALRGAILNLPMVSPPACCAACEPNG